MAASSEHENSSLAFEKALQKVPPSLLKHYETLQPLAIHKVRWFYQEDNKWIPFNGADSIKIENVFRNFKEVDDADASKDDVDLTSSVCATVRGSLYEADVLDRECRPFYWTESPIPIRRGTWFIESSTGRWEPFDENESMLIEEGHRKFVSSLGLGAIFSPVAKKDAIFQIKVGHHRVEWHDISEVFMISETAGSRLVQKMGFSGAQRLYRGYKVNCDENDKMGNITHIVFLVHGMGQLYYGEGSIINSRKKFMEILNKLAGQPNSEEERVEFFPIEWRTKLKLDEGIIDSITPETLGSLRKMLNATTMDVLYYASPLYREEIIQTMREKLNFVYKQFCSRNPYFEENSGKVSIIAHSLGSVIIHDLLTLWNSYMLEKNESNADVDVATERPSTSWSWKSLFGSRNDLAGNPCAQETNVDDLREQLHNARSKVFELEAKLNSVNQWKYNIYKDDSYCLPFKVENVFLIGSPLGVFLVMRGIRPREDMEHHLIPASVCKRYLNIYDPADPIAYRLEPLIYSHYASIAPVRLTHVNTPVDSSAAESKSGWLSSLFKSRSKTHYEVQASESAEGMEPELNGETSDEMIRVERVLRQRIDYVLETSLVEYFSAITSHQGYWHNPDFIKFVFRTILLSRDDDESAIIASF